MSNQILTLMIALILIILKQSTDEYDHLCFTSVELTHPLVMCVYAYVFTIRVLRQRKGSNFDKVSYNCLALRSLASDLRRTERDYITTLAD